MHARDKPLDNQPRANIQRLNLRERPRIQVFAIIDFFSSLRHSPPPRNHEDTKFTKTHEEEEEE